MQSCLNLQHEHNTNFAANEIRPLAIYETRFTAYDEASKCRRNYKNIADICCEKEFTWKKRIFALRDLAVA